MSKFLSVSIERNNMSTLLQSKPSKIDMDTSLRSYKSTLSQHKKENDKKK